ncbi:TIGR03086 family metal-binding protein [Nocardia takedensis]
MDIYDLDSRALRELSKLVESLSVTDLTAWTPCAGWRVRDLVAHMNSEHEAISAPLLGTELALEGEPTEIFGPAVERWIEAFRGRPADEQIHVPKFGAGAPAGQILRVHFADMLVHRWDLGRALGVDPALPEDLVAVALPIAAAVPDRGPLRGPKGYAPSVAVPADASPVDRLVAALGRSPSWSPEA